MDERVRDRQPTVVHEADEKDRGVMRSRARRAWRLGGWSFVAGVVVALLVPEAATHSQLGGQVALVTAGVVLLVAGGALLAAVHPFVLVPSRYFGWLRGLEPFEPETFWGQSMLRL